MTIKIIVAGAAGRMGRAILAELRKHDSFELIGGIESPDSAAIGEDIGYRHDGRKISATIHSDPLPLLTKADAILDFSLPHASLALADFAAQARIVHVIGTTGFDEKDEARIKAAARHATIIKSGNMSLGVNLLARLVELAARTLDPAFDIEIVEFHHRMKSDAPSGTALLLGHAAAEGRNGKLHELRLKPHHGLSGPRASGPIGFASLRGGSAAGDHTVFFAGTGERLELTHRSEDRSIFAAGALKAAKWGIGKGPGLFSMQDVLGL